MGLLFTFEGDDQAKGTVLDLRMDIHAAWIAKAREVGGFPLIRRVSDFYRDVEFEKDEILPLQKELKKLSEHLKDENLEKLVGLCNEAIKREKGIQAIAD